MEKEDRLKAIKTDLKKSKNILNALCDENKQNKEMAKAFFEVIRESTTNAIKHAGSTNIFVEITEELEKITMVITNDGKKSNEFITENDGIKGMRSKISNLNGIFYIQTVPQFSVNVIIKK